MTVIANWTRSEKVAPSWAPMVESLYCDSVNSTGRDAEGHLLLGNNPLDRLHLRKVAHKMLPPNGNGALACPAMTGAISPSGAMSGVFATNVTAASNRAYAKFRKNLRTGQGASLGVTFGSLPQTLDMISSKGRIVSDHLERGPKVPETLVGRGKKRAEIYSGAYLEWIFGWTPLYEDMVAGLTTAITHQPDSKSVWVKGVGTARVLTAKYTSVTGYDIGVSDQAEIRTRVTYAARATVNNPNLWLANKLGLIALPSIAWDLVPWSFIVNGFGNFGQIVSSLTDEVGLTLYNQSVTTSHHWFGRSNAWFLANPSRVSWATYENRQKKRTVGSPLKPSLQMKLPDTSLGYATMVSALVVQKAAKLLPVVAPVHRQHLRRLGRRIPEQYWNF